MTLHSMHPFYEETTNDYCYHHHHQQQQPQQNRPSVAVIKRPDYLAMMQPSQQRSHHVPFRRQHQTPLVLRRNDKLQQYDVMSQSLYVQPTFAGCSNFSPDEGVVVIGGSGSSNCQSPYTSLSSSGTGQSPAGLSKSTFGGTLSSPNSSSDSTSIPARTSTVEQVVRRTSTRLRSTSSNKPRTAGPETNSGWQFCARPGKDSNGVVDVMTQSCIATPLTSRSSKTVQLPPSTTDNQDRRTGKAIADGAKNVRSRLLHILAVTPVAIRRQLRPSSKKQQDDEDNAIVDMTMSYIEKRDVKNLRHQEIKINSKEALGEVSWQMEPVSFDQKPMVSVKRETTVGLLDKMHKAYYGEVKPQADQQKNTSNNSNALSRRLLRCGGRANAADDDDDGTIEKEFVRRHARGRRRRNHVNISPALSSSSLSASSSSSCGNLNRIPSLQPNNDSSPQLSSPERSETGHLLSRIQLLTKNRPSPTCDATRQLLSGDAAKKSSNAIQQRNLEAEATTALRWLKAAGFPQYYQMFIDNEFPVELETVARDHDFLDSDLLEPLLKRLRLLNNFYTSAHSKRLQQSQRSLIERPASAQANKSSYKPSSASTNTSETMTEMDDYGDDDELDTDCALSDRWKYHSTQGRWSRRDSPASSSNNNRKRLDAPDGATMATPASVPSTRRTRPLSPKTSPLHPHRQDSDSTSLIVFATSQAAAAAGNGVSLAHLPSKSSMEQDTSSDASLSPEQRQDTPTAEIHTSPSAASFPAGRPPTAGCGVKRSISDANSRSVVVKARQLPVTRTPPTRTVLGVSGSKMRRDRRLTTGTTPEAWREQKARSAMTGPESSTAISYLYPEAARPLNASLPVPQSQTPRLGALVAPSVVAGSVMMTHPQKTITRPTTTHLQVASCNHPLGRPSSTKNLRSVSCEYSGDSLSRGLSEASLTSETASRASYRDQIRFKEISTVFKECASILQSEIQLFAENAAKTAENAQTSTNDENVLKLGQVLVPSHHRDRLHSQQLTTAELPKVGKSGSRHSLYDNLDDINRAKAQRSPVQAVESVPISVASGVGDGDGALPSKPQPPSNDGLDDILAELQNSMDVLQKSIDGSASIHDASLRFIDDSLGPSNSNNSRVQPNVVQPHPASVSTSTTRVQIPPPAQPAPNTNLSLSRTVTPASSALNVALPLTAPSTASSSSASPPQVTTPSPTNENMLQLPSSAPSRRQQSTSNDSMKRERHDSGVGSSITRSPNEQQRRHRVRWHSFQKSHVPGFCTQDRRHISCMTAGQLNMLRKVALLNLTALVEQTSAQKAESNSQSSADLLLEINTLVKRPVSTKPGLPGFFDGLRPGAPRVFGASLSTVQQVTGQPLPLCILHAMRYVLHNCKDALGIFRRSGVRTRIQHLKEELEANPERTDFEGLSPYDVGDLIKQYFRELPTCLFTSQLSAVMLRSPSERWLEVIENCLLLLPDENREVLHCLLLFLHDVANNSDTHQMTSSNLAICFAPSLFSLSAVLNTDALPSRSSSNVGRSGSANNANSGRRGKGGRNKPAKSQHTLPEIPDHRELMQQKTAHECLALMINNCQRIFTISEDTLRCCRFSYIDQSFPISLTQITEQHGGFENYLNSLISRVTKEVNEENYAWINVDCSHMDPDCQLAYQRPADGHPLRLWRSSTEVDAPPMELLKKIYHERHIWDPDVSDFRILQKLNMSSEIVCFRVASMAPEPPREFVEIRTWLKRNIGRGGRLQQIQQPQHTVMLGQQEECLVVATSIDHPGATQTLSMDKEAGDDPIARPRLASTGIHSIRGINLVTAFVIRPAGSGRSLVHMVARVDYRGRSATWYNNEGNFAAFCIASVRRLRESFRRLIRTNQPQNAPESVV